MIASEWPEGCVTRVRGCMSEEEETEGRGCGASQVVFRRALGLVVPRATRPVLGHNGKRLSAHTNGAED